MNINNQSSTEKNVPTNKNLDEAQKKAKLNKDSDLYKKTKGTKQDSISNKKSPKSSNNTNNTSNTNINNPGNNAFNNNTNSSTKNNSDTVSNLNSSTFVNDPLKKIDPLKESLRNANTLNKTKLLPKQTIKNQLLNSIPVLGTANRIKNALVKGKNITKNLFSINGKNDEDSAKSDKEKDNEENTEKVQEEEKDNIKNVSLTLKKAVKIGAIISACSMVWIIIVLLAALISTDTIQKLIANNFSNAPFETSTNEDTAADVNDDGENSGEYTSEDDSSYIISKDVNIYLSYNTNFYKNQRKKNIIFTASKTAADVDLSSIAEYYNIDCKGKNCENTNIYKFYRKLYDIYYLYKAKYNVNIDMALLTSTLNFNSVSQDEMFSKNINNYDVNEVRKDDYKNDSITNLDWEYDYKKMSGYKYLNANDGRYDMQILAKNMVTKKITYKCGSDSKETKDVETSNYLEKLKCDKGELDEDSINASYELDKDKYDDFLLEYLEHKMYLPGDEVNDEENNNSLSSNSDGLKLVEIAEKQLDSSNSSKVGGEKYWKFMGFSSYQPWCTSFVSWCAHEAGISENIIPKTAAVTGMLDYAQKNKLFHKFDSGYKPKPGDIIIWESTIKQNSIATQHVGIVKSYDSKTGKLATIEGNTTSTSGGAVNENHYNSIDSSGAAGFFSPKYQNESKSASDDDVSSIKNGKTIKLPSGLGWYATREFDLDATASGSSINPYTFPNGSTQREVQNLWIKKGAKHDSDGFCKLDGRYLVAVTETYGSVGDKIDAYLSNGKVIHAIIADIKSQGDPGCSKWGHDGGNNVLEFLGKDSIGDNPYIKLGLNNKNITKIVNGKSVL